MSWNVRNTHVVEFKTLAQQVESKLVGGLIDPIEVLRTMRAMLAGAKSADAPLDGPSAAAAMLYCKKLVDRLLTMNREGMLGSVLPEEAFASLKDVPAWPIGKYACVVPVFELENPQQTFDVYMALLAKSWNYQLWKLTRPLPPVRYVGKQYPPNSLRWASLVVHPDFGETHQEYAKHPARTMLRGDPRFMSPAEMCKLAEPLGPEVMAAALLYPQWLQTIGHVAMNAYEVNFPIAILEDEVHPCCLQLTCDQRDAWDIPPSGLLVMPVEKDLWYYSALCPVLK